MSLVRLFWKPGCTGCVKAKEFLAQKKAEVVVRDLVKQPLTEFELLPLAQKAGGARELVAPKKRKEALDIPDTQLLAWLAQDGKRLRRPIVEIDGQITLGFAEDARVALGELLG